MSKLTDNILILSGDEINRENISALIESSKQFDILLPKKNIDIEEKYKEDIIYDQDGNSVN